MQQVLQNLIMALRASGVRISVSENIDAMNAVRLFKNLHTRVAGIFRVFTLINEGSLASPDTVDRFKWHEKLLWQLIGSTSIIHIKIHDH